MAPHREWRTFLASRECNVHVLPNDSGRFALYFAPKFADMQAPTILLHTMPFATSSRSTQPREGAPRRSLFQPHSVLLLRNAWALGCPPMRPTKSMMR
eukprot:3762205-Amphidinium_carterae.1